MKRVSSANAIGAYMTQASCFLVVGALSRNWYNSCTILRKSWFAVFERLFNWQVSSKKKVVKSTFCEYNLAPLGWNC